MFLAIFRRFIVNIGIPIIIVGMCTIRNIIMYLYLYSREESLRLGFVAGMAVAQAQ